MVNCYKFLIEYKRIKITDIDEDLRADVIEALLLDGRDENGDPIE